jgi:hypothetical protein
LDVVNKYKPSIAVIDVNGTEFDFLRSRETLKAFQTFREFMIVYNVRTQAHKAELRNFDRYFTNYFMYQHIVKPHWDLLKTGRKGNFLVRLPILYRRPYQNKIVPPGQYTPKASVFAKFDDILERKHKVEQARRAMKKRK